jgi:uncharacterized membrane protein
MKECSKCHQMKPFKEFSTTGLRLRLHSSCKMCTNAARRKPKARTNPKRPPGNLGSSQGVRKQQIALQWALDDLLEIVEAKTNDEEIRALAMRVQRLR